MPSGRSNVTEERKIRRSCLVWRRFRPTPSPYGQVQLTTRLITLPDEGCTRPINTTYRECMSINDEGRAPICPFCGVTALPGDPGHVLDPRFICENPDCEAFGEVIETG